jgi:hypothetical protein
MSDTTQSALTAHLLLTRFWFEYNVRAACSKRRLCRSVRCVVCLQIQREVHAKMRPDHGTHRLWLLSAANQAVTPA